MRISGGSAKGRKVGSRKAFVGKGPSDELRPTAAKVRKAVNRKFALGISSRIPAKINAVIIFTCSTGRTVIFNTFNKDLNADYSASVRTTGRHIVRCSGKRGYGLIIQVIDRVLYD